jgi:hypothetical protein
LLRRVWVAAARLEPALQGVLEAGADGQRSLDIFLQTHWKDAAGGRVEYWEPCDGPARAHWHRGKFVKPGREDSIVQVNVLRGEFLVDGNPVGRLPATITGRADYSRIFGDVVFEVQPAAGQRGKYVSLHALESTLFSFELDGDRLIVVQRYEKKGDEYELIPHASFKGDDGDDLPVELIDGYSHWLLKGPKGGVVVFRPVKFDDPGFNASRDKPDYRLALANNTVTETKSGRLLVDVRSKTFKEICGVMDRLDDSQFVHIFVPQHNHQHEERHQQDAQNDYRPQIILSRLGLHFVLDASTCPGKIVIHSREHGGMRVDNEQNVDTLIGLRHGLVLRGAHDRTHRKILIPHGNIDRLPSKLGHQAVHIRLESLHSPAFFEYDIDRRFCKLHGAASKLAWLYLAQLHAETSHVLPDPLTGLTGTEMALQLLQSPRCWSSEPWDAAAIRILSAIAKLSPQRSYYPPHMKSMQTVAWPAALPSMAAHDALWLLARQLVADGARLASLHGVEGPFHNKLPENDGGLLRKEYWRTVDVYGPEGRLRAEHPAFERVGKPPTVQPVACGQDLGQLELVRCFAAAGYSWTAIRFEPGDQDSLRRALMQQSSLKGATDPDDNPYHTAVEWADMAGSFPDSLLGLYNLALQSDARQYEFTMMLSFFAFAAVDPALLRLLQQIAVHSSSSIADVAAPREEIYEKTAEFEFDASAVQAVIEYAASDYSNWPQSRRDYSNHDRYTARKQQQVSAAVSSTKRYWPRRHFNGSLCTGDIVTRKDSVVARIDTLFVRWDKNRLLNVFVEALVARSKAIEEKDRPHAPPSFAPFVTAVAEPTTAVRWPLQYPSLPPCPSDEAVAMFNTGVAARLPVYSTLDFTQPKLLQPFVEDAATKEITQKLNDALRNSWNAESCGASAPAAEAMERWLQSALDICSENVTDAFDGVRAALSPRSDAEKSLAAAGLWHRIVPSAVLRILCEDFNGTSGEDEQRNLRSFVGAYAVLWTHEQRFARCLALNHSGNKVALQRELANRGYEGWSPAERPRWLILQIENDFMIRGLQVKVATQMMHPSDDQSMLMQLNMGEGKTSVIVPMLLAALADGTQLVRLTVLTSLFRTNVEELSLKLGGLLNQRVYTFPCRRDMVIDQGTVQQIHRDYQRCMEFGGVVVTIPEHRLSFELKFLETCSAIDPTGGHSLDSRAHALYDLRAWLGLHIRDVLDESDEILHVKYQLIYTMGPKMDVGGGHLRWNVAQAVLQIVKGRAQELADQFGPNCVELKTRPDVWEAFPHIRLLPKGAQAFKVLSEMVVDDILGDEGVLPVVLRAEEKNRVRSFILNHEGSKLPDLPTVYLEPILILRGLLTYEVLYLALSKRWRVEFGVHETGPRRMAVPFRAKDKPAERTEFGHPDIAIACTLISYYNSGLRTEQVDEALQRLHQMPQQSAGAEYLLWMTVRAPSAH